MPRPTKRHRPTRKSGTMPRSKPNSQSPSSFATDPFLSQLPLLNLTIEKLVIGGAGLARIQSGSFQNMVIFIPFACPGDHVEVRITKKHKNHLEGRIERILEPGPSRRTPPGPRTPGAETRRTRRGAPR